MPKKLNYQQMVEIQDELRKVESMLESCGSKVCSVEGGSMTWTDINRSLEDLRDAIRDCHYMICCHHMICD